MVSITMDGGAALDAFVELPAPSGSADLPDYTLLGPVGAHVGRRPIGPRAPKVLQVLAMLLARAGRVVSSESLHEELWPEHEPRSARTTLQTYVYQLRRCLSGSEDSGNEVLVTHPFGYRLDVDPDRIDVMRFLSGMAEGNRLLADGQTSPAMHVLRATLALWSGPPMAGVVQGPRLSAYAVHLVEQRRAAYESYVDAAIRCGEHAGVVGELRSIAAVDPLAEWVHLRLMRALGAGGRRGEALAVYHALRRSLHDELAIEPGVEVGDLYRELITDERR